jgi:hypothetical protein
MLYTFDEGEKIPYDVDFRRAVEAIKRRYISFDS